MKNNLERLIEDGIKIKRELDKAIMNDKSGLYSEKIMEWNAKCTNYLTDLLNSDSLLFQFIKSDQILTSLKNYKGAMISLFETPYSLKKEPIDISNILENKLDFLIAIQNQGKKAFEKIDGVEYSFNKLDITGRLVINGDDPIRFNGKTALILKYFYIIGKENNKYSTYKDFNLDQEETDNPKKVNSKFFSQAIRSINSTVNKTNKNIKEIICKEKKSSHRNMANAYKWGYKDN